MESYKSDENTLKAYVDTEYILSIHTFGDADCVVLIALIIGTLKF